MTRSIVLPLVAASSLIFAGCGGSDEVASDPAALEAAFKDAPAEPPVEAAPAAEESTTDTIHIPAAEEARTVPVQQLATQAATAIRKDDYAEAMVLLQTLRRAQNLTPQQLTAVQDQMSAFQADLAQKAEAGDPKAKKALELISQSTRW